MRATWTRLSSWLPSARHRSSRYARCWTRPVLQKSRVPEARLVASVVEEAHRRHWSAVLAATVRLTRDIDLAEDCTQDAFVSALRTWPNGVPNNPAAWLTTVARRTALDRLRRETTLRRKLPLLAVEAIDGGARAGVPGADVA